MARVFYRLSDIEDPEERLEDAALSKALFDVLGEDIRILPVKGIYPEHGLHLGRSKMVEAQARRTMSPDHIPYWEDPGFRAHTSREWGHFDLEGAEAEVARLHEKGKPAFLKSTLGPKHMVARVDPGQSLTDALGPMVYSFCDRDACLLVQEAVDMRYERRFLVMNGEVVTQSAVGYHLTPMSRFTEPDKGQDFEDYHLETPTSRSMVHAPDLTDRMYEKARQVAADCGYDHVCIDLCLIGDDMTSGPIEVIEFNPMQPGMIGLFGCDPYAIAHGVEKYLELTPEIGHYKETAHPAFLEVEEDEDALEYDF